jgi:DNA mismatch repair ATPase MutS
MQEEMSGLLDMLYELDVCIAVSGVARERGFCYGRALPKGDTGFRPKEDTAFRISGLFHPVLRVAVGNALSFNAQSNVLFLTGANMAGKSTLMKALGIAVYLGHMGFPVAAESMEFSVMDGLYSSINVSDDLGQGYSHFYAEVLRVKKVAEEVSGGRDLVVIFDELFKGTNVKDAYDATLAVTAAFAAYRNCFFLISTHIVEVGASLKGTGGHVQFAYLPSIMDGLQPRYTYQLQEGISADRHGMMIIQKEGILELIS